MEIAEITACLTPSITRFKTMITIFVNKTPKACSIPKYFLNINGGTVTPPFDAPIWYRMNIPKLNRKLPTTKATGKNWVINKVGV